MKNKKSHLIGFVCFLFLIIIFLECYRIKLFSNKKITTYTKAKQETEVFLYPGYLVKDSDGIFWYPQKPIFQGGKWQKKDAIPVTGCIFDPWPYTDGGFGCIMRLGDSSDTN